MSVYKAVSNYFVEILDFLQLKIKQYESLSAYFKNIGNDGKKELLIKVSDILLRINMLFIAREKYWLNRKKEQNAIYAIFITISVIIGVMFYSILYLRIKKETSFKQFDNSYNMPKIAKAFLSYSSIYMVILTVFVMMIINAKKIKDMCDEEAKKARREGEFYIKYMFDGSITSIEKPLFNLAIASRGKLYATELIDGDDLPAVGCPPQDSGHKPDAALSKYFNCATGQTNYIGAYDAFKADLEKGLISFYDNGNGYDRVRKIYILSGPMPMLKETRRIIDSYYFLVMKDRHGKNENTSNEEQKRLIVKENVIEPLQSVLFSGTDAEPDTTAFNKCLADPGFATQYDILKNMFTYLAAYSYQIYIQKKADDAGFPSGLKPYLPNTSNNETIKTLFRKHQLRKLNEYFVVKPRPKTKISAVEQERLNKLDAAKINDAISKMMMDFRSAFNRQYTIVISHAKFDHSFLYNKEQMQNDAMSVISQISAFNDTYKLLIKEYIYNDIILPMKADLDTDTMKLNLTIDKIVMAVDVNNINITRYNEYILSELTNNVSGPELKSKGDLISDTLSQIYKAVNMKKQLRGKEDANAERFLEQNDFVEVLDSLRYNELKSMLETGHLSFIIDSFYKKINDSISRNDKISENIYFNIQKNHKIYHAALIMTIVTLILVWLNFFMSNAQLYKYLYIDLVDKIKDKANAIQIMRSAARDQPDDKLQSKIKNQQYELDLLYREKRNRTMNWYIRIFIPLFVLIFVISLLLAFYKKAKATHEFNVDLIETNTSVLKNSVNELKERLESYDLSIALSEGHKKIKDLVAITNDEKQELFKNLKIIIEKYEKCNFILEAQKSKLPFPYNELAMSGFMIFVTAMCMIYVFIQMKPVGRLKQIRELNKMKDEAQIADKKNLKMLRKELEYLMNCHEDDIDAVIFTLKVVFFIFIITFLIFYSSKVISGANAHKDGLYNSVYFESGSCVP